MQPDSDSVGSCDKMAALIHYSDKFNDLKGMSCGEVLVRRQGHDRPAAHAHINVRPIRFPNGCYLNDMHYTSRKSPFNHLQWGGSALSASWLIWTTKRNCHILLILIPTGDYASPETGSRSLCCGSTQQDACGSDILAAVGGGGEVLLWLSILAALRDFLLVYTSALCRGFH